MSYGNISTELSADDVNSIIQTLQGLNDKFPFAIKLSPDDRRSIMKLGDKSLAFVEKALEYAENNPNILPVFFDLEEFKKDMALTQTLNSIVKVLRPLTEKIEDTFYAVGAEAFFAARTFYSASKGALKARVPGTETIVSELGIRYKLGVSKTPENNAPSQEVNSASSQEK